jgi:hypothetical protein
MQMALDALDTLGAGTSYKTHNTAKALRDRLAQPEWVGLTDEEVWECYSDRGSVFYRAVEAKLKEKNT